MSVSKIENLEVSGTSVHSRDNTPFHGLPLDATLPISSLSGFQCYADDFLAYVGPNTAAEGGGWVLTETSAGAGNAQRVDVDDSMQFGYLKLLTDNGANDLENLQRVGEPWRYVVGKRLWFFAKLRFDDVTKTTAFVGLALTDTALIAGVTDGIYFKKATAATAAMDFMATKDSASTTLASVVSNLVNNTDTIIGFVVETNGQIKVYQGASVGAMAQIGLVAAGNANIVNDEDLTLSLAVSTSEVVAHAMSLDWVIVAQER